MRLNPAVGLTALLLLAAPVAADEPLYTAVITQDAEVRSGPGFGAELIVTNRLHRGEVVQVTRERPDGWLEILPPAGSVSWISTRFLKRIAERQANWAVIAPQDARIPVFVGTSLRLEGPLTVAPPEGRVVQGTQVRGLGEPQAGEGGQWLPIEPPPGERRYIRADLVSRSAAPASGVTVSASPPVGTNGNSSPNVSVAPGTVRPAASAGSPTQELQIMWEKAVRAEQAGDTATAVSWYNRLAAEGAAIRPDWAADARARARFLSEAYGLPPTAAPTNTAVGTPGAPATTVAGPGRLTPTPADPGRTPTVRLAPPGGTSDPPGTGRPATPQASAWQPAADGYPSSGPGILKRAGRVVEGRKTYRLDSTANYPLCYVTAGPNVDLEPYVDQKVELFGPAAYKGDLRANYMTVMRVQPLP
jgi:hypothetical protein